MPGNPDPDAAVKAALASLAAGDLPQVAPALFGALGYRSTRVLAGQSGRVEDFIAQFPAPTAGTLSEQNLRNYAAAIHILFQVTDEEINEECSGGSQGGLFDTRNFDEGINKSYLFLAVELNQPSISRSQYAELTREINKRFPMPAFLLFHGSGGLVTLAFVQRRRHKRDDQRRVLGSVSLIRDIDPRQPHRAHRSILKELSLAHRLAWMGKHGKPGNFDGLLAALLASLDTQELNKRFYKDLFGWFNRVVAEARFPANQRRNLPPQEHVIRLITRLLFVWFIKEKGLVAEELFIEEQVRSLLKNYDPAKGDSYYRAVLQNLFFATLNTEISQRGFSARQQTTHRDFSRYRHQEEMADPERLLALFKQTPFINGGLFDCLDSFDATSDGGYRIDCFSDNPGHRNLLSVPNRLFFAADGLVSIFNRYKFTVEENTPVEQEVALDPELLGKVFENLLAAINPETRETARRQTGSYYTPRLVVDTMVEEALVAALAAKAPPHDGDRDWLQERLRYLLDYEDDFNDARELFEDAEAEATVGAIAGLKVLDPAVGSGAFPMGILHKLTLALQRLDPDNTRWQALQKERAGARANAAFETKDQQERDAELLDISQTFERYSGDFGRKLYLIQNSIFGVDIQPVACQIAKLRFFISLAIEQQPNNDPIANYGVKPLPNLETRFVAANTLLALDSAQGVLTSDRTQKLYQDLRQSREQYFHANTRDLKLCTRQQDRELRDALASELRHIGMADSDAEKISRWDPYDQNAQADWFDAKYMFGNQDGFDVVIGNPPYQQVKKGTYPKAQFPFSEGRDKGKQNLYKLFVEQSYNLCKKDSIAILIVQSSLMCDLSSAQTRRLLLEHTRLRCIIEFPKAAPTPGAKVFQSVTQGTCIYQFVKSQPDNQPIMISVGNDAHTIIDLNFTPITRTAIENLYPSLRCFPRIEAGSVGILEKIAAADTIKPLKDYAASIAQGDLNLTTHAKCFSNKPTKVRLLRGRHVGRFILKYSTAIEYCDQDFMREQVKANREGSFLISQEVTGTNDIRRLHFGLAEKPPTDFLCGHSVNKTQLRNQAHNKAFLALLNSRFMDWFFRITSTNNHVQGYQLEQLPIPLMTATDREQLGRLVASAMQAKATNPAAETSALEAEIDRLVYQLYGLTTEEIAVVEGASASPGGEAP
ncbi:MAG: N-6 DNA methylase [Synechococcus sp. SB0676_bin_10]|uniref:site-specific DNA-methyltransferase (adenine-specific) n=1 Tax=Synechococcus sp. SB0676_bin_10 TaxID=2604869 RepID=A0A6B1FAW5_9SYNE|nr:N-6 DNA methylase [Synechococcus sp. SB0676_bin_10]